MTLADLLEEIRTLLREAQGSTVEAPWLYDDMDLIVQLRSAFRYLRALGYQILGVPFDAQLDQSGVLTGTVSEFDVVMIGHLVAGRLIGGDLIQKLSNGEISVVYKAGFDSIDTTTATRALQGAADGYLETFRALLTIALSNGTNALESIFGDPTTFMA